VISFLAILKPWGIAVGATWLFDLDTLGSDAEADDLDPAFIKPVGVGNLIVLVHLG